MRNGSLAATVSSLMVDRECCSDTKRSYFVGTRKGIIEIIVGFLLLIFFQLCKQEVDNRLKPPPSPYSSPLLHPPPTLSSSKPGGPYLCLDHADSLVSQVLQGSGNINLFSTCNRARIGASSKQQRNPAHICQSLFTPAPFGAALRLKIITFIPGKTWSRASVRSNRQKDVWNSEDLQKLI